MDTRKIKLELKPVGMQCRLWIDGEPVTNAVRVEVVASVGDISQVTLTLIGCEVEVEGEVETTALSHEYRTFRRVGDKPE